MGNPVQKILLVSDNPDVKELLTFQITSRFPLKVQECASARDAADLLKKNQVFALLVGPYNGPNSVLVKSLRELKHKQPVLFFCDPLVVKPEPEAFTGLELVGTVEHSKLVDGVLTAIEKFLHPSAAEGGDSEFCPIRTNLLIKVSPLKSEIYIRLNDTKFVKLFRAGDEFDTTDLEKYYEDKKVEYMYLRRNETAEFITKFRRELEELLQRKDLPKEEGIQASEMSQEAIQELVHSIGFTEEVQELAKKNVELTLKTIGSNPRLSDLINKISREGSYISQHSTVLAHVACCVAKEMDWGSDATFSKLVLASYMHDISLKHPELAKINTLRELEEKKAAFPPDEAKQYHLHPAKAADVVRSFKEVPSDVDIIVQQHHERPNGSGFPRGLLFNYISPLSSLFIVAHDLAQAILFKRASFSLSVWVSEKKPFFNQGNFKKVMAALEKVKL
jgi:HD-GYP domain-containing protein (c-di-GMP phosphodiesterase class II)